MLRSALILALVSGVSFAQEMIDNPQYKSWAKHKPGTQVVYKSVTTFGTNKNEVQMTYTLKSLDAKEAVVEMKSSMTVMGRKIDQPGQNQKIPAKVKKQPVPTSKPTGEKPKESSEDVSVGGKSYKCKVMTVTSKTGSGATVSKTWMCEDIPGGLAKMESSTSGQMKSETNMTVASITLK